MRELLPLLLAAMVLLTACASSGGDGAAVKAQGKRQESRNVKRPEFPSRRKVRPRWKRQLRAAPSAAESRSPVQRREAAFCHAGIRNAPCRCHTRCAR